MIRIFIFVMVFFVSCGEEPELTPPKEDINQGSTSEVGQEEGGLAVQTGGKPPSATGGDEGTPRTGPNVIVSGSDSLPGDASSGGERGAVVGTMAPPLSSGGVSSAGGEKASPAGGLQPRQGLVQEGGGGLVGSAPVSSGSVQEDAQRQAKFGRVQEGKHPLSQKDAQTRQGEYYFINRAGAWRVIRVYKGWNFVDLLQSECLIVTREGLSQLAIFWGYRIGGSWRVYCSNKVGQAAVKCGSPGHYELVAGFLGDLTLNPLKEESFKESRCKRL